MKSLAVLTIAAATLASAQAAPITTTDVVGFTYSTDGTFTQSLESQSEGFKKIAYFDQALTNTSTVNGSKVIDLGRFTLALPNGNNTDNYANSPFTLLVSFTAPTVIAGGGDTLFSAKLQGFATKNGENVTINFLNASAEDFEFSRTFKDSNGHINTITGGFTFALNTVGGVVDITTGTTVLKGTISNATQTTHVPEGGATVALLGLSMTGLAAARRKFAARA